MEDEKKYVSNDCFTFFLSTFPKHNKRWGKLRSDCKVLTQKLSRALATNMRTNKDSGVFCSFQSKQNPCYFLSRSSWDRYKQKYRKAWELDPNFRGKYTFNCFLCIVCLTSLFSFSVIICTFPLPYIDSEFAWKFFSVLDKLCICLQCRVYILKLLLSLSWILSDSEWHEGGWSETTSSVIETWLPLYKQVDSLDQTV